MIKKIDLISEIMMCFASIMGTQVFPLEVEFLEKLPYWNVELEADFKEQLVEKFKIDIDLSKLKPLTFDKIADYIKQEQASDTRKTREKIRKIKHYRNHLRNLK